MDDFFSNLYWLATDYFAVLIVLYWLALFHPKKILLYIAIALACVCITSFIGYPDFYIDWLVRWFLEPFNLLPSIEGYENAEGFLPELHMAFSRGFFLAFALFSSFLILLLPILKLGRIKGPG